MRKKLKLITTSFGLGLGCLFTTGCQTEICAVDQTEWNSLNEAERQHAKMVHNKENELSPGSVGFKVSHSWD